MSHRDEAPRCGAVARTLTLQVSLDDGGRPTGTLRDDSGDVVAFIGWLDLIAELTNVLGRDTAPSC